MTQLSNRTQDSLSNKETMSGTWHLASSLQVTDFGGEPTIPTLLDQYNPQ